MTIERLSRGVLPATLLGLLAGGVLWLAGARGEAGMAWALATLVALVPLSVEVVWAIARGRFGVDLIAILAMGSALLFGQPLASAVVALMLSGGNELERFAGRRAESELRALLARAPHVVHRHENGRVVDRGMDEVARGDRLLVKPGEVVPVDGVVVTGLAVLDEAAMTGESVPVEHRLGDALRSGTVNAGPPFDLRATTTSAESTYSRLVRLVAEAQASRAPMARLADRYSVGFLVVTVALAAGAGLAFHDPVRAVAVLVIATPCPLILATPIALVAGMSRAARRGVIVKGGGPLEALAQARTVIFDKTGTLTSGHPRVARVIPIGHDREARILAHAAALDRLSPHVFATAVVAAADAAGAPVLAATAVRETPGAGIEGTVDGRQVRVGKAAFAGAGGLDLTEVREVAHRHDASTVFVGIDGRVAGAILLVDPVRDDAGSTVVALRRAGVDHVVLLSGDRRHVSARVGDEIGADVIHAETDPEQKLAVVRESRARGVTVMVGDGVNDAPSLAAADVGIAMGARGATASSEAADVVIGIDRLDRVAEVIEIAQRTRAIALQSIWAGMLLSGAGMLVAAAGALPPVGGALVQEAIDVAVILNALRALGGRPTAGRRAERTAGAEPA